MTKCFQLYITYVVFEHGFHTRDASGNLQLLEQASYTLLYSQLG